ncbi:transposase [Micromonospora matsumotoense]|uniref:transposase n=1 Tax=Micromonospora matsumotoense TaxID=121616 RepID=UPI0033E4F42A
MVMKHYLAEFKAGAVALFRSRPGVTIAQVADDLGVNRETLRSWVRADDERRGVTSGPAAPPVAGSVEDEHAALRRRVRERHWILTSRGVLANLMLESRDCLGMAGRGICALLRRMQMNAAVPGQGRSASSELPIWTLLPLR